jgi:hypothetical protein
MINKKLIKSEEFYMIESSDRIILVKKIGDIIVDFNFIHGICDESLKKLEEWGFNNSKLHENMLGYLGSPHLTIEQLDDIIADMIMWRDVFESSEIIK